MTGARGKVWAEVLDRLAAGESSFSTQNVVESVDSSYQTVLRALDDIEEEGWIIKVEPDDREFAWKPSPKARSAFEAYSNVHRRR